MTSDPYVFDSRYRWDLLRDVLAVVLLIACVAGLTWVGFETDWRLGVTVLSVAAGALSVALGTSRS